MPNDKYEDEIRDILNRMDRFIPEDDPRGRRRQQPPPKRPQSDWLVEVRRKLATYNSTSYLVGTIVFALVAGILHRIYPPFGMIAALLSVGCLLAAIVLPMLSRSYGRPEQRWRGRVIELSDYRPRQPFSWRLTWWRIKRFFGWR